MQQLSPLGHVRPHARPICSPLLSPSSSSSAAPSNSQATAPHAWQPLGLQHAASSSAAHAARGSARCGASPKTAPSTTTPKGPADLPAVQLPESQEQAISEAVRAVQVQLAPLLAAFKSKSVVAKATPRKKGKGFDAPKPPDPSPSPSTSSPSSCSRFAIEIPAADDTPSATARTSLAIAVQLARQLQLSSSAVTLVFADAATAAAAVAAAGPSSAVGKALSLQEACRSSDGLRGVLLLVAPKVADVALVEQLLTEVWTGPGCVMLNPEFPAAAVPEQYRHVSESVHVVWSFLPLMISGILGNMEGAVLRRVAKPGPDALAAAPWSILYKVGDKFVQVGQTKQRPKRDDLELTMMNASAAASPLTKAVKTFKGLIPNFGGQKAEEGKKA